jgi:pyridoxamine 5'-phosphate oxidase
MRFDAIRREYSGRPLDEASVDADPIVQFHAWFAEAIAVEDEMANAMALATVDAEGAPSLRMVLLKGADARGFVWYTNYDSRKGRELRAHPRAALLFYWSSLDRQIRIEGPVEPIDAAESDAYFASRPRASNLSAMASPQSRVVGGRGELEEAVAHAEAAWHGRVLERPSHWGGFRLAPARFEFWQGRQDRLHDRVQYLGGPSGWTRARLAP